MTLEARPSTAVTAAASNAVRALGLRVAAVDLFSNINGRPEAPAVIEVNSNPSIRLLEDFARADLILKIWHHTFSFDGIALVFELPDWRRHLSGAVGGAARIARGRSRLALAPLGGSSGLERQGQHGGILRQHRQAHGLCTGLFTSPHLYRFNERFQIDGSPIGDADAGEAGGAGRSAGRGHLGADGARHFGAFEAHVRTGLPSISRTANAILRCSRPASAAATIRSRLVGARVTCVTSVDYEHVELLGHSLELIVSDKSDACACRRHRRLRRELPGPAAASRRI